MKRLGAVVGFSFALALIYLTALTGNSDAIDAGNVQDTLTLPAGKLDANHTIGQTFTARADRLDAIQVSWVASPKIDADPTGQITLHLRRSVTDTIDLAAASLKTSDVRNAASSKFTFAPIEHSAGQSYYFFLDATAASISTGTLSMWASGEDVYPGGQLYVDSKPINQDLAFRAFYEPNAFQLVQALSGSIQKYLRTLIFAVLVVLLPGLILFFAVKPHEIDATKISLLILMLIAFAVALLQIRDVAAPLWVDSPPHAAYVQSIVQQAQIPLERFYHLGYHVIVAFVVRLSGASIPDAMLIVGQLLLVQVGLSVFLLSRKLTASSFAGLASAIAVWFLSPTPAYFVTWGRYPLVLGCALLPLAFLAAISLVERERLEGWTFLFAALTFAALAFSQIRLIVFYFTFVAAYAIHFWFIRRRDAIGRRLLHRFLLLGGVASVFGMLWLGALIARGSTIQSILALNAAGPVIDLETARSVMFSHHGIELLVLAIVGIMVSLARRTFFATMVSSWYISVALIAFLAQMIGGRPYLEPALVVLMAFLPVALFVGNLAQLLLLCMSFRGARPERSVAESKDCATRNLTLLRLRFLAPLEMTSMIGILLISLIGLAGIRDMVNVVNPATILFFDADRSAMEWIKAHTPPNAKFLVNSYAWFDSTYVPSDGGVWIPIHTGRTIDFLSANHDEDIAPWMTEHKIDFVYLGRRAGMLTKSEFIFQPESFNVIYNREGVKIFQLRTKTVNP
ncbi:MAG: hypothetical protein HZB51_23385 [Chloroflexi bacterium]|nr:hypothetical protein [Chloroflexota bacterium]